MQPYFLPYLGYIQLINAVDTFVFFDDVNFIKKGWINRNNILVNSESYRFTIPLSNASQNRLINETEIANYSQWKNDFLKLIQHTYKKATFYSQTAEWLNKQLNKKDYTSISDLASEIITSLAHLFGMQTRFLFSSNINYTKSQDEKGQDKILSICKQLNADTYINPKNGIELYNNSDFVSEGIELKFIHMENIEYVQFKNDNFVPNLSVLDVLMFNEIHEIKELLNKYTLQPGQ